MSVPVEPFEVGYERPERGYVDLEQGHYVIGQDGWPSQSRFAAGLLSFVASTSEITDGLNSSMLTQLISVDFGVQSVNLVEKLDKEERKATFGLISGLMDKTEKVSGLFPQELRESVTSAYYETVSRLIFTLNALKGGRVLPAHLALGETGSVAVGAYTFEQALGVSAQLDEALATITSVAGDRDAPVQRVNESGAYGMYRIGDKGEVLATVRLLAGTAPDPAIEYANRHGSQASIGFSVDTGRDYISPYKKEQRDSFSIRVDNEGHTLALDIGSILGRPSTLGKDVANLLALGDWLHCEEYGKQSGMLASLNHNAVPFSGTGLELPETFAGIASSLAADLETRSTTHALRLLALKQTVAA